MILIQGHVRVHADDVAGLRAIAAPMLAASRAEPGCIFYSYAEDVIEPGLVHIIERWADQAALDAHNVAPHFQTFSAALAKFRIEGLRIAAYDTHAERVLIG
jgi:quinol monooxygenase YgiN